jgi:hypothetical protein
MAARNALATASPAASGDWMVTLYLVTGFMIDTESIVWCVCLSASGWPTTPLMATIGSPSEVAVAAPVTRLEVPGPDVTKQTPGRPVRRPTAAAMNAAFCMPADNDLGSFVIQHIERRHDLSTGYAEDKLHFLIDEAANKKLSGRLFPFRLCSHRSILSAWFLPHDLSVEYGSRTPRFQNS